MQLINLILEARAFNGGAELKLASYLRKKTITAYYPLHEKTDREILERGLFSKVVTPQNSHVSVS